jgi:signal peptidase II
MQAARGASLNSSEPDTTEATRNPAYRRVFLLVALTLYLVDVVSKVVAVDQLTGRGRVDLVGDWFGLHLTRNPGAAFSMGTSFTLGLSVLAMVAVVTIVFLSSRLGSWWWAVGLGSLLAGVSGNLTDRLLRDPAPLRGHVIDFFELPHWPIFNVADICIDIAVGVIILQAMRGIGLDGRRHDAAAAKAEAADD